MTLDAIRPAHFSYFPYDGFTFSLGLVDGEHAWLSGHSGAVWDERLGKMAVAGDMRAQAAVMYQKIGTILSAANLDFSDVVHLTENVTLAGLDDYAAAAEIRTSVLATGAHALTTVVVERLVRRAALIEVEVTARRGGGHPVPATSTGGQPSPAVETDAGIYLPTILPIDDGDVIVGGGDVVEQYRFCLTRASELLGSAGLALSNIARIVDYTTPASTADRVALDDVSREMLGPVYPAAGSFIMSRLHRDGVLVAVDVVASGAQLVGVEVDWPHWRGQPYSPAVTAGRLVYVSAVDSLAAGNPYGNASGGLEPAADAAYRAMLEVVHAAGAETQHIVQTLEFVTANALADYRAVADVRRRRLLPPWPASVGAVCHSLAMPTGRLAVLSTALLQP